MKRTRVVIRAADNMIGAGLTSWLQLPPAGDDDPVLEVIPQDRCTEADVVVVAAERLTPQLLSSLRRAASAGGAPVVLVVDEIDQSEILNAVQCRVVGVIPRAAVTAERLRHGVLTAATGGGVLPPSLISELIKQVERLMQEVLQSGGSTHAKLTAREVKVLRLVAEGLDTLEIAEQLAYSERTVKNVVHGLTTRLNLRNRPHAVAYAMRTGLI
ncbi:response regulator transcription factor [Lentzea sp. NPDC051213]|uniref:response regulator transcription factor n=1 Tax=Lentzea sp. NPDC051213 TaxID=3364126 RepID=UPI00379372EE